jgi:hypothetical protein
MQTSWFTETLRSDLEAVGSMGSDKAMKVADRMITVALPLAKARMLEAMSMALTELSGVLGIERIDLRVSGDDVTFVPAEQAVMARTAEQSTDQARFSLRLPDDLKARIDERATAEGTSTNTWMVRALESAVGRGGAHHPTRNRRLSGYGQA